MARTIYKLQASIAMDTGLPEDVIVNTWHFLNHNAVTTQFADAGECISRIAEFYSSADTHMASNIGGGIEFKVYDLQDVEPRVPVRTATATLTPSTDFGLPFEVALCLSYKGLVLSGDPPARRRGRVFFGPVANTLSESSGGRVRPTTTFITLMAGYLATLLGYNTGSDIEWCVYSPTSAATPGDFAAGFPVQEGWVDNAWDTMRSRGAAATSRVTF